MNRIIKKNNGRILNVEGVLNVRDLGGLKSDSGEITHFGKFIRSANLHFITEQGAETLEKAGVSDVIDLRSSVEVSYYPTDLSRISGMGHYNVPMLDKLQSNMAEKKQVSDHLSLDKLYEDILNNHKSEFLEIFNIMAESSGGVLFHCAIGKDRTGIISMILLTLAQVPEGLILEDYSMSEEFIKPIAKNSPGAPSDAFLSNPKTLKETIKWLNHNYGSVSSYLDAVGLKKETQEILQNKLILPV